MGCNVQQGGNRAIALTFEDFNSMCRHAESIRGPLPVRVQFRKRGEILCGLVLDAVPGKGGSTVDFFQLESDIGVNWTSHQNVRACSGVDGRCTCSPDSGEAIAGREADGRGHAAAPLGNTGVAA